MIRKTPLMKFTSRLLIICLLLVSFQHAAMAGIVSTTEIVDRQVLHLEKRQLQDLLSRQDVQSQLTAMGVDPDDVTQRLANMTEAEIRAFAADLNEQPAGSGVVGTLALIFIILLITDLMGYTEIFPFVKRTIHD